MSNAIKVGMEFPDLSGFSNGLSQFKQAVKTRVLRGGVAAMARVVAKTIKPLVTRQSGLLARSLGIGRMKTYPSGIVLQAVQPRHGFAGVVQRPMFDSAVEGDATTDKRGKVTYRIYHQMRNVQADPRFYAHLVEFGVAPHSLGKGTKLARARKTLRNRSLLARAGVQGGASNPGFAGRFFMKRGTDAARPAAKRAFEEKMRNGIDREEKKSLFKKGKKR